MYLNFVWHFHQPIYRLPDSQEFILPWVNYHATRNYWQMLRIVEEIEFPCTINLVPCLLEQIEDYAAGRAVDAVWTSLEKPADRLSPEEQDEKIFPSIPFGELSPGVAAQGAALFFFSFAQARRKDQG
ncbi:MAG: hypothetical protein NUW07_03905 [Candidatus Saccharicenans sp.]|nr:hypothetical protein [Candidatus Saccharicenans sp.]